MSDVTNQVSTDKGNPVKLVWADISNESYRTYFYPTGSFTIQNPVKLNVKRKPEGDSHRVLDDKGAAYYLPAGWIALKWEGKNGETFSF